MHSLKLISQQEKEFDTLQYHGVSRIARVHTHKHTQNTILNYFNDATHPGPRMLTSIVDNRKNVTNGTVVLRMQSIFSGTPSISPSRRLSSLCHETVDLCSAMESPEEKKMYLMKQVPIT